MKYVIGNWKMNMQKKDMEEWINNFSFNPIMELQVIVAPSAIHIPQIILDGVELAAQDVSLLDKGAHTGELGAFQIKEYCKFCIVGHSERNEPREIVYKKRDMCLEQGVTPIVCFVNTEQLLDSYKEGALTAWEDPKNISKNGVFVDQSFDSIKSTYNEFAKILPEVDIIYGGSVNRNNIGNLVTLPNLAGVLPGHASLDPQHFKEIIEAFEHV